MFELVAPEFPSAAQVAIFASSGSEDEAMFSGRTVTDRYIVVEIVA